MSGLNRVVGLAALTLFGANAWAQEPPAEPVEAAAEVAAEAGAEAAVPVEPAAEPAVAPAEASPIPTPEVAVEVAFPQGATGAVGQAIPLVVSFAPPAGFVVVGVDVAGNRFVETVSEDAPVVLPDGRTQFTLAVAVFRSGNFEADGIEAVLIDANGRQHRVSSAPFSLEVQSSIVNESDPQPAPSDGPMAVLTRDMRPLYAGVALGFVLLGLLIAAVWRRAKTAHEEAEPEPTRPGWETAFEALDRLEADGLLEAGEHLEFHMRLSEILRAYLGDRFAFFAPEMTTHEIANWMNRNDAEAGGYRDEIIDVLSEMDIVKFARFTPPLEMSERCFASARTLVTELSAREREQLENPDGEGTDDGADGTGSAAKATGSSPTAAGATGANAAVGDGFDDPDGGAPAAPVRLLTSGGHAAVTSIPRPTVMGGLPEEGAGSGVHQVTATQRPDPAPTADPTPMDPAAPENTTDAPRADADDTDTEPDPPSNVVAWNSRTREGE